MFKTYQEFSDHMIDKYGHGPSWEPKLAWDHQQEVINVLQANLKEEIEATNNWRRLALQFDNHRMIALHHLKAMVQDVTIHKPLAEEFLQAGPLGGEEVLAHRIAEIADASPVAVIGPDYQMLWSRKDWSKDLKVGDLLYTLPKPTAKEPGA